MRRGLSILGLCVCSVVMLQGQQSDGFHLKAAPETTKSVQTVRSSSSASGGTRTLSDGTLTEVEDYVSSTITQVVDEVLDMIGNVDWSDFLEKLLPQKFKDILAEAGLWPVEGTPIDIDMKEMTDMGKEVMDNIYSLRD